MSTIKLRRDTAANWLAADPVLSIAEPGLETDTNKIKSGDGTSHWSSLPYANGGGTVSYTPATASDWTGTPPTTIQEALDRLAAAFKTANGTGA